MQKLTGNGRQPADTELDQEQTDSEAAGFVGGVRRLPPDSPYQVSGRRPPQRPEQGADGKRLIAGARGGIGDDGDTAPTAEAGTSGLSIYAGRVREDYNLDLQSISNRMSRYEEMRRGDTAPAIMELLLSLILRASKWEVKPVEGDDTEVGAQIAARINQNLFGGQEMDRSFGHFLRRVMLAPLYGFSLTELVWQRTDDNRIMMRKFADRARSTVRKWYFEQVDGLWQVSAVEIRGRDPGTGEIKTTTLDADRCVIWTWREENDNPEGLGAFRQCWKPWNMKCAFEEWAGMRIERHSQGVPMAYPDGNVQHEGVENEGKKILDVFERCRAGEMAGIVVPLGWTVQWEWPGSADVPFEGHIERQHQYMLQTMLAQMVSYSQGGASGSYALSRDTSSLFRLAATGIGKWFCDEFNHKLMPRYMRYNRHVWRPRKMPLLTHGTIGAKDIGEFGSFVRSLFGMDVFIPQEQLNAALEQVGLPKMSPEEYERFTGALRDVSGQDSERRTSRVDQ